jgi:hypothetical protein
MCFIKMPNIVREKVIHIEDAEADGGGAEVSASG